MLFTTKSIRDKKRKRDKKEKETRKKKRQERKRKFSSLNLVTARGSQRPTLLFLLDFFKHFILCNRKNENFHPNIL
jgi:hypothetical protein